MRGFHKWSSEEKKYLEEITPGHHHKEILQMMNRKFEYQFSIRQITGAIKRYNLNTGFTGHFKKGHEPFNKGVKGVCAKGCEKTWFKKGHKPVNYKQVGSERVNVDGYIEIKVAEPNTWELKHRVVWEKEKGKIPRGYAVIFADGNRQNTDINNLMLVSRKELLVMNGNGLIKEDAELTKTGKIVAELMIKVNEKKK